MELLKTASTDPHLPLVKLCARCAASMSEINHLHEKVGHSVVCMKRLEGAPLPLSRCQPNLRSIIPADTWHFSKGSEWKAPSTLEATQEAKQTGMQKSYCSNSTVHTAHSNKQCTMQQHQNGTWLHLFASCIPHCFQCGWGLSQWLPAVSSRFADSQLDVFLHRRRRQCPSHCQLSAQKVMSNAWRRNCQK